MTFAFPVPPVPPLPPGQEWRPVREWLDQLYQYNRRVHSHISTLIGSGSGADHGALSGLSDDDHAQYIRVDGTRAFTGVQAGVDPTSSTHLTTRGYEDTNTPSKDASYDIWRGAMFRIRRSVGGAATATADGTYDGTDPSENASAITAQCGTGTTTFLKADWAVPRDLDTTVACTVDIWLYVSGAVGASDNLRLYYAAALGQDNVALTDTSTSFSADTTIAIGSGGLGYASGDIVLVQSVGTISANTLVSNRFVKFGFGRKAAASNEYGGRADIAAVTLNYSRRKRA